MSNAPLPPPLPTPVRVLSYTAPMAGGRPGAVTAIGMLSVILGALGILTAAVGSIFAVVLLVATATAAGPLIGPPVMPVIEPAGPSGFLTFDRLMIQKAFESKQPMTSRQTAQLNFLLSDVGQKILPAVPAPAGGTAVDPAADYEKNFLIGAAGANPEGGVYYDVPIGRISLSDTDAAFTPSPGTKTPAMTRSADRSSPQAVLTPAEVTAVVSRAQELADTTPLNTLQWNALANELARSGPTLVGQPADMPSLLGAVSKETMRLDGTAVVDFLPNNKSVVITPGGIATVTQGPPSFRGFPKLKTAAMQIVLVRGVISGLLAVFLLIIGILTLRDAFIAGRLHRIYAWAKIFVTLIATALTWGIWGSVTSTVAGPTGLPAARTAVALNRMSSITTAGGLLLGLAYPIALLMVLRSNSVRAFYRAEPLR